MLPIRQRYSVAARAASAHRMSLLLMTVIVLAVVAASIGAMYCVRRRAPSSTLVTDFDRTGGVFGFVGTAFAVLVAFVIFQAFDSYSKARSASGQEAIAVQNVSHLGALLPGPGSTALQGELECYGRAVVALEWPAMRDGESSPVVERWIVRMRDSLGRVHVHTPAQQAAYQELIAADQTRSEGRAVRLAEANPIVAAPLWFILIAGGALTIACALMFIDRRDSFWVEAILIAAVSTLVAASLLIVDFFDHPYRGQPGSIEPTAMRSTLTVLAGEDPDVAPPCAATGAPASGRAD